MAKDAALLVLTGSLLLLVSFVLSAPDSNAAKALRAAKAEEMLRYLNTSADPCEDFFEYSCGNYDVYLQYTADKVDRSPMAEALYDMQAQMLESLQTAEDSDNRYDKQLKNFFHSCVYAAKAKDTPRKLRQLIEEFGEMPILAGANWKEDEFDWLDVMGRMLHKIGSSDMMIDIEYVPDFRDNSKGAVLLGQGELSDPKKAAYLGDELKETYLSIVQAKMTDNLLLLGVEKDLAAKTAQEMYELEVALAQGMRDDKFDGEILDVVKLVSLEELKARYLPNVDFGKLLEIVLQQKPPSHLYVEGQYVQNFVEVMRRFSKREIANYLFYRYVIQFAYSREHSEPEERKPGCLAIMQKHFYKSFNNMFYRKFFDASAEQFMYALWNDLKTTFAQLMESSAFSWISQDTRRQAIQKVKAMKLQLNSYKELDFAKEFDRMTFTANDYVGNMRSLLMARGRRAWQRREGPPALDVGDQDIGASYMPITNSITVALNFAKPNLFWSSAYPEAYNWGQFLALLAHELVHGFDDKGRMYDLKGNNVNWWDESSSLAFEQRKQCFVKQYAQYEFLGSPLGETQNQGENIADNGGIRLAYRSYRSWYGKASPAAQRLEENFLPGMSVSADQLFFISHAQMWCENVAPGVKEELLATDVHTPSSLRPIAPLANMPEFAAAFKCKEGSVMNPRKKCKIY